MGICIHGRSTTYCRQCEDQRYAYQAVVRQREEVRLAPFRAVAAVSRRLAQVEEELRALKEKKETED